MSVNVYQVLKRPIITEKNTILTAQSKYSFEIAQEASKQQVKEAVEKMFKVNVIGVNVITVPGKMRRVGKSRGMTSPWRKAVVTLQPGQRIELFEGV
jgi:large subunit ribosomal protein L23